ncbi:histidine kinase [Microbacterium sp. zg.B48]|uniref:sensor histidine kinase n=1 Tax=unclassified Microbacterium TaxID=2609290 RepID=UPI00214BDDCB|nr:MULTISPECIES: histidine kinase [unclassified Microbacterium]MCR2764529.1 histidine kinase [Microbacterium sp. zg.B48]MCR2810881.1 histidine kinase [Microbacterium sp. zg.B185]WIM19716.1 histidine kinase [Microbacterium sp. zg-B185]
MTSQISTRPVAPAPIPQRAPALAAPLRIAGAVAQLAALGVVGPLVFTVLVTLLAVGLGLVPVLGIGLVLLLGFVYGLYGLGWLETARVDGLYSLGLPGLRPRTRTRPGFGGFLRMVWDQFTDPSMWRAIASAAIASILGLVVLPLLSIFASGIVLAFAPLFARSAAVRLAATGLEVPVAWASVVGVLAAVVALAAVVGIALLHGVLARVIVIPTREAQLTEQARTSDAQRAGALRASEVERTRIERDLHDGVQPRLVSVGMTLGLAQQKMDDDPAAAKALLAEAHTSTKAAITELRQLARGIHASVLDDRGLDAALSALAGRSHIPVHLDVRLDSRCSRDAEAAVYFAIAETLTNAAKHSRASECRVIVRQREGGTLWARVEDNGIGGAQVIAGGGLDGISNRILAARGTVRLESPQGGPTSLEVSVPCAS